MAIERIKVLGVGVDICRPEDFENEILADNFSFCVGTFKSTQEK